MEHLVLVHFPTYSPPPCTCIGIGLGRYWVYIVNHIYPHSVPTLFFCVFNPEKLSTGPGLHHGGGSFQLLISLPFMQFHGGDEGTLSLAFGGYRHFREGGFVDFKEEMLVGVIG